ncbi:MAG TPA: FecR domain-containing protein [Opitutaceae bacterium]|nr:FecR domain-containing protein [Opitutaceae bacterium]
MKSTDKIETEAALWVVRIERGLTAAEQDDFLQWLTADPRHGRELDRQSANWSRLNGLADWRPEHSSQPNRDLLAPQPPRHFWKRFNWTIGLASAGLAAIICLGIFFYLQLKAPESFASAPAEPAQIGKIERRTLDDGTIVELNRGAEVAVLYTARERKVRLEKGEAMFRVAKNPNRPFLVIVDDVQVRAVGTAFNVRRESRAVELIVTEGKVRVSSNAEAESRNADAETSPLVQAGEFALVPLKSALSKISIAKISPAGVDEKLAWQSRLLDFTNARLSAVVEEFNRRNAPIRIVIDSASLADTEVSASLRSDNIDSFIRLLEGGFGVEADRHGNVIILRQRD